MRDVNWSVRMCCEVPPRLCVYGIIVLFLVQSSCHDSRFHVLQIDHPAIPVSMKKIESCFLPFPKIYSFDVLRKPENALISIIAIVYTLHVFRDKIDKVRVFLRSAFQNSIQYWNIMSNRKKYTKKLKKQNIFALHLHFSKNIPVGYMNKPWPTAKFDRKSVSIYFKKKIIWSNSTTVTVCSLLFESNGTASATERETELYFSHFTKIITQLIFFSNLQTFAHTTDTTLHFYRFITSIVERYFFESKKEVHWCFCLVDFVFFFKIVSFFGFCRNSLHNPYAEIPSSSQQSSTGGTPDGRSISAAVGVVGGTGGVGVCGSASQFATPVAILTKPKTSPPPHHPPNYSSHHSPCQTLKFGPHTIPNSTAQLPGLITTTQRINHPLSLVP